MLSLGNIFSRFVKGVKRLKTISQNKLAVVFETPHMANQFVTNSKFLDDQQFLASIPASAVQKVGIIKYVPVDISNQKLFEELTSTIDIISIRRFMKKIRSEDGNFTLEPLQTVAITFSSNILPEHVDLKLWRFPVQQYIAPVKQCFNCLKFGHMARSCRNATRCSICAGRHPYKDCSNREDVKCANCSEPHIAISIGCPIKKQKIEENKRRITQHQSYQGQISEKKYPSLKTYSATLTDRKSTNTNNINIQRTTNNINKEKSFIDLINNDLFLNSIVETIIKIVTQKTNEPTNCQNIKELLIQSFNKHKSTSHDG